jgi:hypothetical protein
LNGGLRKSSRWWKGADVIVFDSYVWWMKTTVWGAFSDDGYEELDAWVAFWDGRPRRPGRHPGAVHVRVHDAHAQQGAKDWGWPGAARCYYETRPVARKGYWGRGSDGQMMEAMAEVLGRCSGCP